MQNASSKKRMTVAIFAPVYEKVKEVADQRQTKIQDYINDTLLMNVDKDVFLKGYAPQLSLEHVSENSIFLFDSELDCTVIIKVKNQKYEDLNIQGLFTVFCETCKSDSCIHVRFAIGLPEIARIRKEGKMASTL